MKTWLVSAAVGCCSVALLIGATSAQASPVRAVPPCSSNDISLGVTTASDQNRVVVTVSLHHFRGSTCSVASHASVSLLSAPKGGAQLKVAGNPAIGKLNVRLRAKGTAALTFAWSNWCGSS